MLEEAASELFLEEGYARVTVTQIARRAGVSRATFFNYFSSKSDVLWADVDEALASLPLALAESDPGHSPDRALHAALGALADRFGPRSVPWVLTQFEAIGSPPEVLAAAMQRLGGLHLALRDSVAERTGASATGLSCELAAGSALAALVAAVRVWSEAGPSRSGLREHLDAALALQAARRPAPPPGTDD